LKNVSTPVGHWIELRLVGDLSKKSSRDAIGAIAYVTTGKLRQRLDVISGSNYASNNDVTLHFGIGAATSIDKIEIKWPDGLVETIPNPAIDRKLILVEPRASVSDWLNRSLILTRPAIDSRAD